MVAIFAAHPQETLFQAATLEEVIEFLLNVARQVLPLSFQRELEDWIVLLNQLVEQGYRNYEAPILPLPKASYPIFLATLTI